mmetsp:Transcript_17785/g.58073  ORF Transcript_17785/g.58073 Transcript_17785/m.58073 type:complete len:234 (-) Transcript_17785:228-929(-)
MRHAPSAVTSTLTTSPDSPGALSHACSASAATARGGCGGPSGGETSSAGGGGGISTRRSTSLCPAAGGSTCNGIFRCSGTQLPAQTRGRKAPPPSSRARVRGSLRRALAAPERCQPPAEVSPAAMSEPYSAAPLAAASSDVAPKWSVAPGSSAARAACTQGMRQPPPESSTSRTHRAPSRADASPGEQASAARSAARATERTAAQRGRARSSRLARETVTKWSAPSASTAICA